MRNILTVLVLLFITLLTGMLTLTAIAQVRQAADRMSCSNNLHSIGIGLHSYASAYEDQVPMAAKPNPDLPIERRLSWLVTLVPFVESTNLTSRLDQRKGWDEENRYLALTTVKYLQCPAFPRSKHISALVPTNYVGIAGLGADVAALPLEDHRAGFFGYERTLKLSDIAGHTSTLIAVVETTQVSGAWSAGGPSTVRGLEEEKPYFGTEGQFGGTHLLSTNVLFADGSVRFLRGPIDADIFRACVTIKGSASTRGWSEHSE